MNSKALIPRGNNVLIEMHFQTSVTIIHKGDPHKDPSLKDHIPSYRVISFGSLANAAKPEVEHLRDGDWVLLNANPSMPVNFPDNERSIVNLKEHYAELSGTEISELMQGENRGRIEAIECFVIPEFMIHSIIREDDAKG